MGGQLGTTVTRENALIVHPAGAGNALAGLKITQIPNVLTRHIRLLAQELDSAFQHIGLIFLAEHFGRLGMLARDGIRAELGQDKRLAELHMQRVQFSREQRQGFIKVARLTIPAQIAVQAKHIAKFEGRLCRAQEADHGHRAGGVEQPGIVT